MPIDLAPHLAAAQDTAPRAHAPAMDALQGSTILAIAGQVRQLRAEGKAVFDLTIGDFDPKVFPIPEPLADGIAAALRAGETSYPPAVGVQPLREAIVAHYRRLLDVDVPVDGVLVGSGARPPIYAAFLTLVAPGDVVVYPVPSWNVNHYTTLSGGRGIEVVTSPETGFMPTVEQLRPHLAEARLVVVNSPQNPSGTVLAPEALAELCDAILAENARRRALGARPLFLLYDAVYGQLAFAPAVHVTPWQLRPAMAPYTIVVDAISKCWAATGLRVGWCVAPPWVQKKMAALVGHMGAWAGRAEQVATAQLLREPERLGAWPERFLAAVQARLTTLRAGFARLADEGFPVRALGVEGAIYLSVQLDLIGRTAPDGTVLANDEALRAWLLRASGVAAVPFSAFGYPDGSGWMRLSVGSVRLEDCEATIDALRTALAPFRRA